MEVYQIITLVGFIFIITILVLVHCNIRYKGKCVLHNWEYRFEYGDYWKVTGSFLRSNERDVCLKCGKKVKR